MRVGFSDPQGPRLWRSAPYALPALLVLFAMLVPLGGTAAGFLGIAAFALFNLIGAVSLRQRKPRTAELVCGAGFIDIKKSGSRSQRIVTTEILGASTARGADGVLLSLQHRDRDQPITIAVGTETEAQKIRHALGIGHGGFGTLAWSTHSSALHRSAFIGRLIACGAALVPIAIAIGVSSVAGMSAGLLFGQFGLIGALLGFIGLLAKRPDPSVVMTAEGLRLNTPRGWFGVPYDAILHIEDHRRGLVFSVPQPHGTLAVERVGTALGGPSASDCEVLIAQVLAAAQRARGMGPRKEDATGRVEVLRRSGESPRDWLVRLDMTGQMLSAGHGYRGNTIDAEDLWTILEDPEAEADLRAAAARVLRHGTEPETRVRIVSALAAVRDEATQRRLRVAIEDDLDSASQELATLDAADPRRSHAMPARYPR